MLRRSIYLVNLIGYTKAFKKMSVALLGGFILCENIPEQPLRHSYSQLAAYFVVLFCVKRT